MQLTPRSRIEEFARAEYRRKFGTDNGARVVNLGNVLGLMDDELLVYRGRAYRSPPVSYADAVRLFGIAERSTALGTLADQDAGTQMREIARIQAQAVRLFWMLVTPVDWRRWVPKAFLRNPFRNASPREVDDLLGFFWLRQTSSSVRAPGRAARAN
jgi:hypothetical protein